MATENPGAYPLDPDSPVGRFRLNYGDTSSEPFDPPRPGEQNYVELSDIEIESFIAAGGDSISRGIGMYYMSMSGQAAKEAINAKDYDHQVDRRSVAGELRAAAQMWFDRADAEDAANGDNDIFEIFGFEREFIPEGVQPIYGRRYVWDEV